MNYNIAVFSVELFTPTAKFIKRDFEGLGNVTFFSNKKRIPSKDFTNIEISSPRFSFFERLISYISRKLQIKYFFMSSRMKKYYRHEFKNNNIDVVVAHFGPSGIDILDICKELNIPLITVFHGYDISKLISNKAYLRGLTKLNNYKLMNARAVSSFFVKDLSNYIDKSKIFVLENGVEVRETFQLPTFNDQIYIIQASNLVEKKGIKYSIKSVKKLIDLFPDKHIQFDICGDGVLRSDLEELVGAKYKDNIIFHGHLAGSKFETIIKRSNIFMHPSVTDSNNETETIPTAILEAMSNGKIVVSTFHAGIPEVIEDGYNGFLVEEKNSNQLTEILTNIISNKYDLEEVSSNAHKTIFENFNSVTQYKKFKKEINRINNEK